MKSIKFLLGNLTIGHIWAITVLAGVFIFNSTHPIRPYDFWMHIALGRYIVAARSIPIVDVFSYTWPGAPSNLASGYWLMDVCLYFVYTLGGGIWVIVLHSIVVTFTYGIVLYICWRASGQWRSAALGALFAVALGFNGWNVRPQIISYLLFSLILLAIYEYRIKPVNGWLFLFPLVMVIWVNSHPSFPFGLILIGLWLFVTFLEALPMRNWRNIIPPVMSLIAAFLACLVAPHGADNVRMVFTLVDSPIQQYITEWAAPTFGTLDGGLFFSGLLGASVLMGITSRRISALQCLYLIVFGYFGIKYTRGSVWFGIIMSPVISVLVAELLPVKITVQTGLSRLMNKALLIVITGLMVISLPWFKSLQVKVQAHEKSGIFSPETPIDAAQYLLDNKLPGNVFNDMGFGSYMMWATYPNYKVFIDPRFDIKLYPIRFWDEYIAISAGADDWEEKLASYNVNTLMLSPDRQSGLVNAVKKSGYWTQVYQDEAAIIFVKR